MNTRQITKIAFMAATLICVFQLFANVLYLEGITFTVVLYGTCFKRKEAVLACVIFACLNFCFIGITPWSCMYLLIYPGYAYLVTCMRGMFDLHPICLPIICGFFAFLSGQLLDLPFLLFSREVTILYWFMGLKTSLIQGILGFLQCVLLYDPLARQLHRLQDSAHEM